MPNKFLNANIFQQKKRRTAVVLFALVLLCCSLAACKADQSEPPVEDKFTPSTEDLQQDVTPSADNKVPPFSSDDFFALYRTDFPDYTYDGEYSADVDGRVITLKDAPKNFAEEMVWNNEWLPFVGEYEPYIALMGSEHMLISAENEVQGYSESESFSTVIVHSLSTLTEQNFQPSGFYFSDGEIATRFLTELWNDVHEYSLMEYTVAYVDLSREWMPERLELGPQLGDGRYERLYLLGKTPTNPEWKLYNVYWGEYALNRTVE